MQEGRLLDEHDGSSDDPCAPVFFCYIDNVRLLTILELLLAVLAPGRARLLRASCFLSFFLSRERTTLLYLWLITSVGHRN